MEAIIIMGCTIYFSVTLDYLLIKEDLSIFNPIINYNRWTQFNWFGIAVLTLLLNIVLAPYAIIYWIYKLFIVGRK